MNRTPRALDGGGMALWRAVTSGHDLDPVQRVILHEACRVKDRLDQLDEMVRNGTPWAVIPGFCLHLDADTRATQTADLLRQLLASLRLPDRHGRRPQRRGTPRGAYAARAVQRTRA